MRGTDVPLKIFISYAHEDEELKNALLKHLAILRRQKKIETWDDHQIEIGSDWRGAIGDTDGNLQHGSFPAER